MYYRKNLYVLKKTEGMEENLKKVDKHGECLSDLIPDIKKIESRFELHSLRFKT